MGFLDLFNKSGKKNSWIAENAVPADKKPLLQTGGILIYTNQWTPQTLKVDPAKMSATDILSQFWSVENKDNALARIESLLTVGGFGLAGGDHAESRAQIDARLATYTAGERSALSEEESAMLDKVVKLAVGYKFDGVKLTESDLGGVTTTLAWDIERAAFIARLAYNCGYLAEEETWALLQRTREMAASALSSWRDYGISFIKGRAIVMCHSDFSSMSYVWANVCLMAEPKWGDIWAWEPLR